MPPSSPTRQTRKWGLTRWMLPVLIVLTLMAVSSTAIAQTPLALGDIAFTGYNADGNNEFSFVLFKDVDVGTTITFTDNGWFAAGGFRSGEGTVTLTFTSAYSAGRQITIATGPVVTDDASNTPGTLSGSSSGIQLAASGDQLFAYQGTTPTAGDESAFIAAIQMNGNWNADASDSNSSAQPSVFTDGLNSISIAPEVDNARYNCTLDTDTPAVLRAAITASVNWDTDDVTPFAQPAPCTLMLLLGPGGVTTNLQLWLKADAGVSSGGDNTNITSWADQSGNGGDMTPGSGAPNFISTSDNVNFNQYLDFDNTTNDRLNGANYGLTGTPDYQMIFVYNQRSGRRVRFRICGTGMVVLLTRE